MDSRIARQQKFAEFNQLPLDREEVIRRIHDREEAIRRHHDGLARSHREKIEHAYVEFRDRHGVAPVVILADCLDDEFGEELALKVHGAEFVGRLQRDAYDSGGMTTIIYAWSPRDAYSILARGFSFQKAQACLAKPPEGKFHLFVAAMDRLSGLHAQIPG